jgi:hypothetical protein
MHRIEGHLACAELVPETKVIIHRFCTVGPEASDPSALPATYARTPPRRSPAPACLGAHILCE